MPDSYALHTFLHGISACWARHADTCPRTLGKDYRCTFETGQEGADGTTTTPRAVVATTGSSSRSAADPPLPGLPRATTRDLEAQLAAAGADPDHGGLDLEQSPARTGARNCTSQ